MIARTSFQSKTFSTDFFKPASSLAEFQRISNSFMPTIQAYKTRKLLSIYASLNTILWPIFTNHGVASRDDDGNVRIHAEKLPQILNGTQVVNVAWTYLAAQIKEYWCDGAVKPFFDKDTIKLYLADVEALGLLTFERVPPRYMATKDPVSGDWRSPVAQFKEVDVAGCLILMHSIYQVLIGRAEVMGLENSLDIFPSHKGFVSVMMFNAVFGSLQQWGRREPDAGWLVKVPQLISRVLQNTYKRLEEIIKTAPVCSEFGWLRQVFAIPLSPEPII
jgi:hypothetical protein